MSYLINDSIRKLATSDLSTIGSEESNNQKFRNLILQPSISYISKKEYNSDAIDVSLEYMYKTINYTYRELISKQYIDIPFAVLVQSPPAFDFSKSKGYAVNLDWSFELEKAILDAYQQFTEHTVLPSNNNNFIDTYVMGKAIYSWYMMTGSNEIVLETDSHLPKGDYLFNLYLGHLVRDIKDFEILTDHNYYDLVHIWQDVRHENLVYHPNSKWYCYDFIIPERVVITLHLTSRSGTNHAKKDKKVSNNEHDVTVVPRDDCEIER